MSKWIMLLACTFALAACDTMSGRSSGSSGATYPSGSSSGRTDSSGSGTSGSGGYNSPDTPSPGGTDSGGTPGGISR